ncbi:MAG: hypothetical protein IOC64_03445, partial [Methylobacterium sp.]|nr:hypothetical protein [Methylobacterium sp.]
MIGPNAMTAIFHRTEEKTRPNDRLGIEKRGSESFMTILVRLGHSMVNALKVALNALGTVKRCAFFLANLRSPDHSIS